MIASARGVRFPAILLFVILLAVCSGCRLYKFFIAESFDEFGTLGKVLITMTLADTALEFAYNQTHLNTGDLELSIGVRMDTDDNLGTGDANGYDVDIALQHLKPATGSQSNISLSEVVGFGVYPVGFETIPVYSGWEETDMPVFLDDENSLYFVTTELDDYLDPLSSTCRSQFYASYNYPSDPLVFETDEVDIIVGSGSMNDPAGDVTRTYIDILSARIEIP